MRTGRSRSVTLPSERTVWRTDAESAPWCARKSTGMSDHGGWRARRSPSRYSCSTVCSDSSEISTAPAPSAISATSDGRSAQIAQRTPCSASIVRDSCASRPVGARMSRRRSSCSWETGGPSPMR